MKVKARFFLSAVFVLCLGTLLGLTACGTENNTATDETSQNREYMAQMNVLLGDLRTELEGFSEAVAQDNIVGMDAQTERANRIIDTIENVEAPEALEEIHQEYTRGCTTLKAALSDYTSLFVEVNTSTEENPFDLESYKTRMDRINRQYQTGIEHLESADQKATELE